MLASGDLTDGKDEDGVDSFQVGQINSELSIQNRQNIFFIKDQDWVLIQSVLTNEDEMK